MNDSMQCNMLSSSRKYRLGSSKIPHHLPQPSKLPPYIDIKAGHVNSWPANAHNWTSKPKFLQNLELYIQKELRALGCTDNGNPSEKRLQTFREAFEYLIKDFHTYRPILSAIKYEYEAMIKYQQSTIQDLEPLKGMIVTLNEQCEHKLLDIKQEEKQDITKLKNENAKLQSYINSLKNEISTLNRQVEKCQEEVAYEYKRYRDESDARKLLIQDINDLKSQQEESKKVAGSGETDNSKEEDPLMLRIALRKAREDLDIVKTKLVETLADYGDVVPRRDYEKLDVGFKKLEEDFQAMQKDYETLSNDHNTLIDVHQKMIEQRNELSSDCARMRKSATPRPDWDKCSIYFEGGIERWERLTNEASSADKVEILLSEMTGHDISVIKTGGTSIIEFFEPKGVDADVPKYLHAKERVRNRRLSKRDLCLLVKDVWEEKIRIEGSKPFTKQRINMADFFYHYLQQRFGIETMVNEWGYNVNDALLRYNYDNTVSLFGSILKGELDEDVYYQQLASLENLYKLFLKADPDQTHLLERELFQNHLADYFTFTTDLNDIDDLMTSAENELGGFDDEKVRYKDLFTEDDEGKSGPFVSKVMKICNMDRSKYIKEICEYLKPYSELNADDLREMFQSIDPKITELKLRKYIELAMQDDSIIANKAKLSKDIIVDNLQTSCVTRL